MNKTLTTSANPVVSIIVPLFNEESRLRDLCHALKAQTYKPLEIILVDNASTDGTFALANELRCEHIQVVQELNFQNADAARNRGLEVARGEIIAFTDGDCLPSPTWVQCAIDQFKSGKADLIAGHIAFSFSSQPSCSESYDSVTFLQHSASVSERGVAFTANLFVRKQVISSLGNFAIDADWNGDFLFTRQAVHAGFSLEYCKAAVVFHPARKCTQVFKKVWRIAWGKGFLAPRPTPYPSSYGFGIKAFFLEPKPHIRHLYPTELLKSLKARGIALGRIRVFGTILVAWMVGVFGLLGFIMGRLARLQVRVCPPISGNQKICGH